MTCFLLFPPHLPVRLSGWQMLYQLWRWGTMVSWACVCADQVEVGGQWRWLNDWGCLLTGGMCRRARSKRLLWTSLRKPKNICFVSFSFFSQSDSFGELGEYDLNVPWTALLGFWHFIEHDTNYWHLKLSLQFSEFSTNVVPLFIFLTT